MSSTHFVLACLVSALPGPPGIRYEDAYLQLFPVDKTKCPTIDPVRDIAYHLFTRNNPLMPDVLKIGDDEALGKSHFNFSDPTVIFFHAFFESSTGTTAWTIKTAYLQRKQHNIILLNAPRLEAGPWYFTAASNTRVVGEYSAKFIDYLVSKGFPLHSLHLVGLSLGAQMAGVTGSLVRSGRVPRITGLDPAGPIFTKLPNSLKLDKGDAEFVDVIHTDAGIFGYPRAIGHVDFWPNGGISPQRGCLFPEIKKRNPDTILELFFCSHWRAYQFYAESVVNDNAFQSVSCKSWKEFKSGNCNANQQPVHMGHSVSVHARGNYFLTTNPESPFSLQGNPLTLAESHEEATNLKNLEDEHYKLVSDPKLQTLLYDTVERIPIFNKNEAENTNLAYDNYYIVPNQNLPHYEETNSNKEIPITSAEKLEYFNYRQNTNNESPIFVQESPERYSYSTSSSDVNNVDQSNYYARVNLNSVLPQQENPDTPDVSQQTSNSQSSHMYYYSY